LAQGSASWPLDYQIGERTASGCPRGARARPLLIMAPGGEGGGLCNSLSGQGGWRGGAAAQQERGKTRKSRSSSRRRRIREELHAKVSHSHDAWQLQQQLLIPGASEELMEAARQLLPGEGYNAVVEERALEGACGYPPCRWPAAAASARSRGKRWAINVQSCEVYDQEDIGRFCSRNCMQQSTAFSLRLEPDPAYCRPASAVATSRSAVATAAEAALAPDAAMKSAYVSSAWQEEATVDASLHNQPMQMPEQEQQQEQQQQQQQQQQQAQQKYQQMAAQQPQQGYQQAYAQAAQAQPGYAADPRSGWQQGAGAGAAAAAAGAAGRPQQGQANSQNAAQAASAYGNRYAAQQQQQQPQQQYQAHMAQQQQQQQQQQPQQQQSEGDEGVGNERNISVAGCTHPTVGTIVRGTYTLGGENHGKPAYKKDSQVNGLDVMLYFWDERDGPNFCGWWFGPKIGGDQVWAYHPSRASKTAPKTGWKVPYDGPVDPTFVIGKSQQAQQAPQQAPQQAQQTTQPPASQQAAQQGWSGIQLNNYARQQQGGQQQQQPQQQHYGQQQQQLQQQQQHQQHQQHQQQQQQQQRPQQQAQQQQQYNQMAQMQQAEQLQKMRMQQEATRRQLDENRKKMEEANKQRVEEQRRRMEEMRQQQEELRKKAEAERLQKEKEMAQKREEQRAMLCIRRVIQKVRSASPENIDELKKELDEVLQKELEACGSQKDRMKQEAEVGREQANQRVEMIKEQVRKAEEQRLEAERKRKEAIEKAERLVKELDGLVAEAERASKTLKEESEPFSSEKDLELEEITATWKTVDEAGQEAKEKLKACTEFVLKNGPEMRVQDAPGQPAGDSKQAMAKLLQRINEYTRSNESVFAASKEAKTKGVQKAEARLKMQQAVKVFDKYDVDKDGMLSQKEVLKYAKGEFNFTLPKPSMDAMWNVLIENGEKGVKKDLFQRLKVSVGIARERIIDADRKAAREAKEKRLAELKAELQEKIGEIKKTIESLNEKVASIGEQALTPAKGASMASVEMLKLSDETDAKVKDARDGVAEVKQEITTISEGIDVDLQAWLSTEVRKLQASLSSCEPRLTRASNLSARFREDARKKEADEVHALEKTAIAIIKGHQRVKKLKNEDVFAEMDTDKDGKITESEFLEFFTKCEREPKPTKAKAGGKDGDAKEGEDKEDKDGDKKQAEPEEAVPSPDDLARLFANLDEDSEGFLSKDKVTNLIRIFMKVSKDTVITSGMSIKESKTLRRLDVGEMVEVIEGPMKEEKVEVMRVHAKVMKDNLDGWITLEGNQGTVFLEDSGNLFKVVKETILTESFEIDSGAAKENARKLKVTTRKLKEGEIVEVREWARKEEASGLMRMKCKAKSDGAVGWVTTVGNQGTVFLEIL